MSALLAVVVWSLFFDWRTGLVLVLLLYCHEAGHVIVARLVGLPVMSPPIFLPGLGAYVVIGRSPSVWKETLIALGGPVIGGFSALIVRLASDPMDLPWLAWVGYLCLVINLVNLLPVLPLDGGRIVARTTGWPGLLVGLLPVILITLTYNLMPLVFLGTWGLYQQFEQRQQGARWYEALGSLLILVLTFGLLFLTLDHTGIVQKPLMVQISSLRPLQYAAIAFALWGFLGPALYRSLRPSLIKAVPRYLLLLVLSGGGYILNGSLSLISTWIALLMHLLGLGTLPWLQRQVERLARRRRMEASVAVAGVYDGLVRSGSPHAQAWLDAKIAFLAQHHFPAFINACLVISQDYRDLAAELVRREGAQPRDLDELGDIHLNNLAWLLLKAGEPALARPLAEAACAQAPEVAGYLDTLGQTYVALGEYAMAESPLRAAIARHSYVGDHIALAQALAGQGRLSEAIAEAKEALARFTKRWPPEEPSREQVEQWIAEWQATKISMAEPTTEEINVTLA